MSSTTPLQTTPASRAARSPAAQPTLGHVGSWELLRLIGQGQWASVYQARVLGGPADQAAAYALKLLRPEWRDDPRGLALLAREAQVGRKVSSPHLLPILTAQLNGDPAYLAMPYLEGCSLEDVLNVQPQLDLPVAFWFARQLATALAALHRLGWTHGDVKPANALVAHTGHITLIDLAFARQAEERGSVADRPLLGTVRYMAPEMLYSASGGDTRSDIYSLGIMLFEMLTGRVPFDAEDVAELAMQHRQELPGDLRHLVPHVPRRAARLVAQMLAKEPLRRPSAAELIDRLTMLEIETFAERQTPLAGLRSTEIA